MVIKGTAMLDKNRVEKEIAEVQTQYANGLCTKVEAIEAMITVVDNEICNYEIGAKKQYAGDNLSDYYKAIQELQRLKHIERFKNKINFGAILNQGRCNMPYIKVRFEDGNPATTFKNSLPADYANCITYFLVCENCSKAFGDHSGTRCPIPVEVDNETSN
jgi:hypothetical protein